jgi:stage V sporulation protein G
MSEQKNGTMYNVRVFPIEEPKGSLRAFASVSFEDFVAIRGLRVNEGPRGLFVSMPRSKGKDDKYYDVAYPTNGALKSEIKKTIMDEYRRLTDSNAREDIYAEETHVTDEVRRDELSKSFGVKIYPVKEPKGTTKAFASVTFEDIMTIRGMRVIDGINGLFVSMPQSKDKDGEYHDIAFPTIGYLRNEITKSVLDEYEKTVIENELENEIPDKILTYNEYVDSMLKEDPDWIGAYSVSETKAIYEDYLRDAESKVRADVSTEDTEKPKSDKAKNADQEEKKSKSGKAKKEGKDTEKPGLMDKLDAVKKVTAEKAKKSVETTKSNPEI